ncbi:MAG: hypothetical protein RR068_11350, partial [Hafnia sp.]
PSCSAESACAEGKKKPVSKTLVRNNGHFFKSQRMGPPPGGINVLQRENSKLRLVVYLLC